MYEKPLPTTPPTCSELLHLAAWLDLIPSSNVTSSSSTVKFVSSLVIKYSEIGYTLNLKYAAENSLNVGVFYAYVSVSTNSAYNIG